MSNPAPESVFNIFYEIEELNHKLYENYRIYENQSISDIWENFINNAFPLLVKLLDASDFLLDRFMDEFDVSRDENDDTKEIREITDKLKAIISMKADLVFLTFIYNNFLSEGIFDFRSEATEGKIKVISSLHSLLDLFFESTLPVDLFESIAKISNKTLHLLKYEKLIPMIESTLIENPDNILLLLDGWKEIGDFYNRYLPSHFHNVSEKWWWDDPLANYHLHDQANRYFLKILEIISKYPDFEYKENLRKVKEKSIPIAKSLSHYYFSKHHFNVAISALEGGNFEVALQFLEQASTFSKLAIENIFPIPMFKEKEKFLEQFTSLLSTVENYMKLTEIALEFQSIFSSYNIKDRDSTLQQIHFLQSKLDEFSASQAEKYGTIILLYKIALSNGEFALDRKTNPSVFRHEVLKSFNLYRDSLLKRINFFLSVSKSENNAFLNKKELENSRFIVLFSPGELDHKLQFFKIVNSLLNIYDAQEIDNKTKDIEKINLFLAILLQTKAFFKVSKAEKNLSGKLSDDTNKIFQNFKKVIQSKVYLYQNNFNLLLLQFVTINHILKKLALITVGLDQSKNEKDPEMVLSVKKALDDDGLFTGLLGLVQEGFLNILNIAGQLDEISRNIDIDINKEIHFRFYVIETIVKFYNAIKQFFWGWTQVLHGKKSEGTIHFSKAKDLAFQASGIFQKAGGPNEIVEEIFSFGIFAQNFENNVSSVFDSINIEDIEKILHLLKSLVFSL